MVEIKNGLSTFRGEVSGQRRAALPVLGALGLVAVVLDVESPGLFTLVFALLPSAAVQPHLRQGIVLVLLGDDLFQTLPIDGPWVHQRGLEPVTHLAVERVFGEVFAAQLPILRSQVLPALQDL